MASALLERAGLMPEAARVVATTLVEGDLLGHDTHGLALLPSYLKELEAGSMTAQGDYRVMSAKPAAQMWDGMRLPGPWLIERGLDVLIPAAREMGVASLAIRRSHHIACLAVFLMRAAREGLMMILASSDAASASVAPFGGTQAVFTPNPIAIGQIRFDGPDRHRLSLLARRRADRYFRVDHDQRHVQSQGGGRRNIR